MKKIVICTSKTNQVNNLVKILESEYVVEVLDSSSELYTVEYCTQFDLIFDFLNKNETNKNNIVKKCSDAGIPVLCGGQVPEGNFHTSYGAAITLGLTDYNNYYSSPVFLISNKRDVLKKFNYTRYYSGTKNYTIGNKLAPDIEPISYYEARTNYTVVNCAVFRKGKRNLKGEKFGSDCAFLGLPYDVTTSDNMRNFTLDVVAWLLYTNEIKGVVTDADGNMLVRDVELHLKDTGYRVDKVKSNENGEFTLRCHGLNNEYFAIAFDEEEGSKNAVIIDKIKI